MVTSSGTAYPKPLPKSRHTAAAVAWDLLLLAFEALIDGAAQQDDVFIDWPVEETRDRKAILRARISDSGGFFEVRVGFVVFLKSGEPPIYNTLSFGYLPTLLGATTLIKVLLAYVRGRSYEWMDPNEQ